MIARILIIAITVTIAAFFSLHWIAYAAAGLILGLALSHTVRIIRRSPAFRRAFVSVLAFAGILALLSLISPSVMYYPAPPQRAISVNYTALISPLKNAPQWRAQEEFLLPKSENLLYLDPRFPEASSDPASDELFSQIRYQLRLQGWESSGVVDSSEQFQRVRDFEVSADWFRATTTVGIFLEIGHFESFDSIIRMVPNTESIMTITSPKYVVGATFPPYSSRVDLLGNGQERLTIPLPFSRLEEHEIRISVLSPLLRWPLGPEIGALSLWSSIKWAFLFICAILSGQIKEKLLKPVITSFFSPRKETSKAEPPNGSGST